MDTNISTLVPADTARLASGFAGHQQQFQRAIGKAYLMEYHWDCYQFADNAGSYKAVSHLNTEASL